MISRRNVVYGLLIAAGAATPLVRAIAGPVTTDQIGDKVQTQPKGQLPDFATTPELRPLYQYAIEHGDELRFIPCTCGCARVGHKSNRDCYIKAFGRDGSLTFTSHAAT